MVLVNRYDREKVKTRECGYIAQILLSFHQAFLDQFKDPGHLPPIGVYISINCT